MEFSLLANRNAMHVFILTGVAEIRLRSCRGVGLGTLSGNPRQY
jgi:hypothetical protein